MPLLHLRVCELDGCGKVRYAACSTTCRVPSEQAPDSWRENLQHGAGQLLREAQ